jgi:hypothetical protein
MQGLLIVIIFLAIAVFVVAGLVSTLGNGSVYDQIGKGGLSMDHGGNTDRADPPPDSPLARSEREQEIRQMLQARSERRVRQGAEPLDIDAELAALIDPQSSGVPAADGRDAGQAEEVRQLVIARNARRERQGQPPLDVESEVARTLDELGS